MADQGITLVDRADDDQNDERRPERRPYSEHAHIDVLYENQRGWFVFGLPLFSSRALWNLKIDQAPWVDAKLKPSPVNITNAQVPDPSWVWEWKSWYVDMSHDVDEEGWQYSLWFRGAAWHGSHPWFHSFVRRRRWLRKRIKQKLPPKTKENRERMFGETFSIGTTLARTFTTGTGFDSSQDSQQQSFDDEVKDVPTLMRKLKIAAIDREKILFINKFIEEGGEELHYLADQVHVSCYGPRNRLISIDPRHNGHAHFPKLPPSASLYPHDDLRRRTGTSRVAQRKRRARERHRGEKDQQSAEGSRGSGRRVQEAGVLERYTEIGRGGYRGERDGPRQRLG
jgi:hypothetical protein